MPTSSNTSTSIAATAPGELFVPAAVCNALAGRVVSMNGAYVRCVASCHSRLKVSSSTPSTRSMALSMSPSGPVARSMLPTASSPQRPAT